MIYCLSDNCYLLFSVGVNGKDDWGRGDEDDPASDDLAIRMPLPKPPRK